ncbi:MAG: hypothetical protein WCL44_13550 [bacterium]
MHASTYSGTFQSTVHRATIPGLIIAVSLFANAAPLSAKMLQTQSTSIDAVTGATRQPGDLNLVVGSSLEYQTDSEETEYNFPFFAEYGITEQLTFLLEPSYTVIQSKDGDSVSGMGDLETSLTYEFIEEGEYLPAFAVEGGVKWPTADKEQIGTGETDYMVGLLASKKIGHVDAEINAIYTFVGSPPGADLKDTLEGSLAFEWHITPVFDLLGEVVTSSGSISAFGGQPGTRGGANGTLAADESSGSETEGTVGFAEHLGDNLKIEQGVTYQSDGTWQVVVGWEWDFAGGD